MSEAQQKHRGGQGTAALGEGAREGTQGGERALVGGGRGRPALGTYGRYVRLEQVGVGCVEVAGGGACPLLGLPHLPAEGERVG